MNSLSPSRAGHVCLSVCMRCKAQGWSGDDERRPGVVLGEHIMAELLRTPRAISVSFRLIGCMSQCQRPCVVALSGEGRFTFLFGDLDPERDGPAVVETLRIYMNKPDGFMERRERPRALQAGILGRVPPLSLGARLVDHALAPAEFS